uniref:Uncharacterized protein n=1 Tax=Denticeps clupeoides TaxID=299321 RepID=A0AAY3ZYW5_9TELE
MDQIPHSFRISHRTSGGTESEEKCDVVLAFCLIVSRAGTDIQAALAAIKVILVVMHHTFDPDHVVPQSSRFIKRENILITVDCLFHEDQGLLRSQQNDAAFTQIQHGLAQLVNMILCHIKSWTSEIQTSCSFGLARQVIWSDDWT